jgi:hypothetical protein
MKNLIRRILKEEIENTNSFDFDKTVYIPETKSIVGPYMIVGEDDKTITVLNIKEIMGDVFLDNAHAYDITIHRVKLPKSQVEILSDVEGKEGFKYIKIPYWLFKNNLIDLDVKRIKGGWDYSSHKKRLSIPVRKLLNSNFISNFKDENVVNYISITNPDRKTNELIRSYAEKGFEPL